VIHSVPAPVEPPRELTPEQIDAIKRWATTPQAVNLMEDLARSVEMMSVSDRTQSLWDDVAAPPKKERA
jgi:hypothetical protein